MNATAAPARILLIDDNRSVHDDYRKVLDLPGHDAELAQLERDLFGHPTRASSPAGFDVVSAYQGNEGLTLVERAARERKPYSLAFVDMRMPPGWDGLETITHLWTVDPHLEVVICTAYSDTSWSKIVDRVGSTDQLVLLKKPFDSVEVVQLAHALTRKRSLRHELQERFQSLDELVRERTAELQAANTRLHKETENRERMEADLRLAQKLESIGQLAAGVAHEINTPAQYVGDNISFLSDAFADIERMLAAFEALRAEVAQTGAHSDMCEDLKALQQEIDLDYLRAEMPRAAKQSAEGIGHIAGIVLAMKSFSHVGTEKKTQVNLADAISSVVTVSRNEWKYVAEMVLDLDPALPPVPCLLSEINQVLLNLVVNAAHAVADVVGDGSNAKGEIHISARAIDGSAEIRVRDTGTGIPCDVQDRVFDPFFTTKEVGRGTGQGLAICRAVVVNKHAGSLRFETEPGRGTTFVLRLPLEPGGAPSSSSSSDDLSGASP
ncbi:MAG: ATP-binding protein [Proteobacteria bacterium]|nr:ATP-binding protein [Pseudomonadota bacterium]